MKKKNLTLVPLILCLLFSSMQAFSIGIEKRSDKKLDLSSITKDDKEIIKKTGKEIELKINSEKILKLLQNDVLYKNDKLSVSTVYPNPANSFATIQYNIFKEVDAKITITNVIGNKIDEFALESDSKSIRLPANKYSSGVYFYTLSIGGKSKASKKFFVKH